MMPVNAETLRNFVAQNPVTPATTETVTNTVQAAATAAKPEMLANVDNATNNLESISNLLGKVNDIINSPLIKGMLEKGVERKLGTTGTHQPVQQPQQLPPPQTPITPEHAQPSINFDELAEGLAMSLIIGIKTMKENDPEKTLYDVYEEAGTPEFKEELKTKIKEVLTKK